MLHVVGDNRAPIGAVGEAGQDLLRASLLLGARGRMADEDLVAGGGCAGPLDLERAGNRDAPHAFEVGPDLIVADSIDDAFRDHRIFHEGRSKLVGAGLHRQADLEVRVRGGSGAKLGRSLIAGDGKQLKPLIVEPQIEPAILAHSQNVFVAAPLQTHRNLIFAIHREAVLNDGAAARADGRVFAQAFDLLQSVRNGVGLIGRGHRDIAYRLPADLGCGRKIAFHQQGRHAQYVSDVVEAVTDVVGGQQLRDVNLERQQIANGIPVLRSVEPVERGASRIGLDLRQAIAPGLDILDERVVGGRIGPRHADRRHLAIAQLARQLLPRDAVGLEIDGV